MKHYQTLIKNKFMINMVRKQLKTEEWVEILIVVKDLTLMI